MKKLIFTGIGLAALSTSLLVQAAPKDIKVQVQLTTPANVSVVAVGFSVGSKSRGSLGKIATKTGPAGGAYSFGIRTISGADVSCGKAKLTRNSIVKLTYNAKICKIARIVMMKDN